MLPIREYRINLGWSSSELAKRAQLHRQTVTHAENGGAILPATAKKLADALSKALKRKIQPTELGLNIQ